MGRPGKAAAATLRQAGGGHWRLDGDLTLDAVAHLAATTPTPGGDGRVELDLAGVRQPSSAGVALLLEWQAALREADAVLVLQHVPAAIQRLAQLANVHELLGLAHPRRTRAQDERHAPLYEPTVTIPGPQIGP